MKVLFAVSNETVSESIVKKYQQIYKEIIVGKNVYYFNAILKELQKDKSYDRIVISEDLEPFTNNNYDTIDNFIFEKLDNISDEASTTAGEDIPIVLIATDRRTKSDNLLIKLFGIGVYSVLLGQDRSIDEVCKLINKPRSKKEAKVYYKIDSNEVDYKPENEGDVSESEIQNILTHYKRLGRNEDRYVESFDNIAAQYTDQQLKVIIKFLPLNVKAVLEENSTRYQQLTAFNGNRNGRKTEYQPVKIKKNNTDKAINNSGIKIESIQGTEKRLTKPVIIPSANTIKTVKVDNSQNNQNDILSKMEEIDLNFGQDDEFENQPEVEMLMIEEQEKVQVKKGRGRPKKNQQEDIKPISQEPKRRGRPKKNQQEDIKPISQEPKRRGRPRKNTIEENDNYEEESLLPGFEQIDTLVSDNYKNETVLPGFEENNYQKYEEDDDERILPGIEEDDYQQEEEDVLPGFEKEDEIDETSYNDWKQQNQSYTNITEENDNEKDIQSYKKVNTNIESLLSKDKKIVAFVGTSKNGTSFLINNLADMLSNQGIKTAILDLTKNRNAYYIYTKNEENLRKIAFSCTENLSQGSANGIKVNSNLDVYTSLPGDNNTIEEYANILETLVKNYSLILLDCDFSTQYEYLRESQEIYLVQSMDVLTIQPLTAYLRDLKAKGILDQNKLRVVINKYTKVRSVSEKAIIGGMAFYNDPAMSFMTELFNRETIPYCSIPFDGQVYSKYLEGLINCNITINGYPKEFVTLLRKLANMVYPLIGNTINYNKSKYNNPKYNKYSTNTFSNEMNSTLDKMKRNY
ncbi:MAG: CpsD/CapB family tyrosine-protein kinase [Clostridiaceae bacterium]|nr:CpsD/CapB family tyrosine-protein kinase [Clostridiaceae bacterium]